MASFYEAIGTVRGRSALRIREAFREFPFGGRIKSGDGGAKRMPRLVDDQKDSSNAADGATNRSADVHADVLRADRDDPASISSFCISGTANAAFVILNSRVSFDRRRPPSGTSAALSRQRHLEEGRGPPASKVMRVEARSYDRIVFGRAVRRPAAVRCVRGNRRPVHGVAEAASVGVGRFAICRKVAVSCDQRVNRFSSQPLERPVDAIDRRDARRVLAPFDPDTTSRRGCRPAWRVRADSSRLLRDHE